MFPAKCQDPARLTVMMHAEVWDSHPEYFYHNTIHRHDPCPIPPAANPHIQQCSANRHLSSTPPRGQTLHASPDSSHDHDKHTTQILAASSILLCTLTRLPQPACHMLVMHQDPIVRRQHNKAAPTSMLPAYRAPRLPSAETAKKQLLDLGPSMPAVQASKDLQPMLCMLPMPSPTRRTWRLLLLLLQQRLQLIPLGRRTPSLAMFAP
jgi:hypothetical protein